MPTIDLAWDNVQVAELQRAFNEAMNEFNENVKHEFERLPMAEEVMKSLIQNLKEQALSTFKQGVLSGSNFLSTPKGEDFLSRL